MFCVASGIDENRFRPLLRLVEHSCSLTLERLAHGFPLPLESLALELELGPSRRLLLLESGMCRGELDLALLPRLDALPLALLGRRRRLFEYRCGMRFGLGRDPLSGDACLGSYLLARARCRQKRLANRFRAGILSRGNV
jgi:hypothetical protein